MVFKSVLVEAMRQLSEAAETDKFNPQISATYGATATALKVGKTKNKVQVAKIDLAMAQKAGKDTSAILAKTATEQKKLKPQHRK